MPIVKCKICRTAFYAKPFWIKRGYGNYCSQKCQYAGRKTGKHVNCFTCGETVYRPLSKLLRVKSKKYFCTKSCQTRWRNTYFSGERHANFINGNHIRYRNILIRHKVPQICTLCKIRNRRILAVHHIDRNHKNNTLKNLAWLCHNCHFLVHHYDTEQERLMRNI